MHGGHSEREGQRAEEGAGGEEVAFLAFPRCCYVTSGKLPPLSGQQSILWGT